MNLLKDEYELGSQEYEVLLVATHVCVDGTVTGSSQIKGFDTEEEAETEMKDYLKTHRGLWSHLTKETALRPYMSKPSPEVMTWTKFWAKKLY